MRVVSVEGEPVRSAMNVQSPDDLLSDNERHADAGQQTFLLGGRIEEDWIVRKIVGDYRLSSLDDPTGDAFANTITSVSDGRSAYSVRTLDAQCLRGLIDKQNNRCVSTQQLSRA